MAEKSENTSCLNATPIWRRCFANILSAGSAASENTSEQVIYCSLERRRLFESSLSASALRDGCRVQYSCNDFDWKDSMSRFLVRTLLASLLISFTIASSVLAKATDADGDPLPPNAVARIGTTRLRHAAYVSSLAFSPDGKRISSATIWFDLGVWDARTGQSLAFRSSRQEKGLFVPRSRPTAVSSQAGSTTASSACNELSMARSSTAFDQARAKRGALVFSRDNHWLASADSDGNTFLWDLQAEAIAPIQSEAARYL